MLRRTTLLALLPLAACAPTPATAPTAPPVGEVSSVTRDPILVAQQDAITFIENPQAGQPAAAARAFANIEYLADSVPADPVWANISSSAVPQLAASRSEMRTGLRIAPSAPSQAVVSGLTAAARAIEANNGDAVAAALPRSVFTAGPQATVRLLSQPVRVPSAVSALDTISRGSPQHFDRSGRS